MSQNEIKILMVCLGNICRSPLAEGILKDKLTKEKITNVKVDSAGFVRYHLNNPPDSRAIKVARKNNVDISKQRQRLFEVADFDKFDKIYVMDENNFSDVAAYAHDENDLAKIEFILNELYPNSNKIVPDPYYGGDSGFDKVFETLSTVSDAIVNKIKNGDFK